MSKSRVRAKVAMAMDYRQPQGGTDLRLVCSDGVLHFSRFILAGNEHFRNLMPAASSDADRPVTDVPVFGTSDNVVLMLQCLHNQPVDFTASNVAAALNLAEMYGVDALREKAEKWCIDNYDTVSIVSLISVASRYTLLRLSQRIGEEKGHALMSRLQADPQLYRENISVWNFGVHYDLPSIMAAIIVRLTHTPVSAEHADWIASGCTTVTDAVDAQMLAGNFAVINPNIPDLLHVVIRSRNTSAKQRLLIAIAGWGVQNSLAQTPARGITYAPQTGGGHIFGISSSAKIPGSYFTLRTKAKKEPLM